VSRGLLRNFAAVLAVLAVLLAGGCKLGPDYQRPDLKPPQTFRWQPDAEPGSLGDLGWWEIYHDPTLQALIREALDNNLDVRIAAARIDQARAALGSAHLQQLPQISARAGVERQRSSQFEIPPGAPPISNVFSVEGSLSYEFDFWGKYRRASEAARAELLASEFSKQDVVSSLVSGVATAYFTLLTFDEQLAITRHTLETRQKFVDLTRAQHERGTVSGLDVATAEAQLAVAQANIPDLERQVAQTEDQLSVLLGHNPDAVLRTANAPFEHISDNTPAPPAGLPSQLLQRRPDLRAAEQNLVAANAQVGVAKAALFPSITLTATGGNASTALSDLFSGPARTWSVGAGLLQPLLDSQRNLYQIDFADAQKREALLRYQKSVQIAFQEVSDALVARQKYAEFQQAQQAQVDAQQRADTIASARYRIGYSSYFNVIDADRDLFTSELTLSSAHLNTLLSLVQLYRALGGGWQFPQPTADAPAAAPPPVAATSATP